LKVSLTAYRQAEVMRVMREKPGEAWTVGRIVSSWTLSGGAANCRAALWQLHKKGMVEHPSGGTWKVAQKRTKRRKPAR
jgi:hypothetical protein